MTINYSEKRNFIRMPINHEMKYQLNQSAISGYGMCKNLSADGVLFSADRSFEPGTLVGINITPKKSVVIPLEAVVEVVRVSENEHDNEFDIAGIIREMN